MVFNFDSWPLKIAIVLALISAREIVRRLSAPAPKGQKNEWVEMIDSSALAIGLVLCVIQPFLLQAFWIPTGSMEPTMPPGDRLIASRLIYRISDPQFRDIIVFRAPASAVSGEEIARGEDVFIKRCIGLPGDTIWAANRRFYRRARGQSIEMQLSEPYVQWSAGPDLSFAYDLKIVDGEVYAREYASTNIAGPWMKNGTPISRDEQIRITDSAPGAIPTGQYLMLGDHRNNSRDGHVWGFIERSAMLGKAIVVFWPPPKAGFADRLSRGVR